MADTTLPDINWGGLAKLFMQNLERRGDKSTLKKKPKPAPALPKSFMRKQPAQANKSMHHHQGIPTQPARPLPHYPQHPQHPQVILSQIHTLRMQLLQQLIFYQKQLLALQIPLLGQNSCCHTNKQCQNINETKRKPKNIQFKPSENTQKWLKASKVNDENFCNVSKSNKKKKLKRRQKRFIKNTSEPLGEGETSMDSYFESNNWYECGSNNDQYSESTFLQENNYLKQESSNMKDPIVTKHNNMHDGDSYERAIALERLRNVPLDNKKCRNNDFRRNHTQKGCTSFSGEQFVPFQNKIPTTPTFFSRKLTGKK